MNEFESRYFPLKREFPRRVKRFSKDREVPQKRVRITGSLLRQWQVFIKSPFPEAAGKKLAFISDWHWHDSPRQQKILAELTSFMRQFAPDILLLGGDMCDDADTLYQQKELLEKIAAFAPLVMAVGGNWESGKRWLKKDFFAGLYRSCGINYLENSEFVNEFFAVTGMPDISSIKFHNIELPVHDDKVNILMTHNPDGVVALDKRGFLGKYQLIVCGHNHGGQVRVPFFGAVYCPSFYHRKFVRGIFRHRDHHFKMLVSSGIGEHRGTFRCFCPPEVLTVEFK